MPKTRTRGTGIIYRRGKKGKIWWLKYYANGQPVYESSRTTDRAEAQRMLRERVGDSPYARLCPGISARKVANAE
jgi:hypothetical protein